MFLAGLLLIGVPIGVLGEMFGVVPAHAETIRVLLLEKVDTILLSAAEDLRIMGDRGGASVSLVGDKGGVLRLVPMDGGIRVQGKLFKTDHLIFRSSRDMQFNKVTLRGEAHLYKKGSSLSLVDDLDIEDYLKGVLGQEMPWDWALEALKAQAIAARTYALHQKLQNKNQDFDVGATTDHQVYNSKSKPRPSIDRAVNETRGLILYYEDSPILAAYHSTCGGQTEDVKDLWGYSLPYLKSVSCPFEARSPHHSWKREVDVDQIERALRTFGYPMGTIASLTPYHRDGSGRVDKMRILHSKGELFLGGGEFRKIVGYDVLPSASFQVESWGSKVGFSGKGRGHGVGLCQWGAKGMAEEGYRYPQILTYYYPGAEIAAMRN